MVLPPKKRVTQRDIARLAEVSQATVSLVLNNRTDTDVRIGPQARERVLRAIAETGYVADPVGRRLAARFNRILGVFTYEPAFPSGTRDFYHPFLVGIEEYAERIGCDLLLFTSAPVTDGRRRIFRQDNRLRLADGCILLGRQIDQDELARLVAEEHPFVAVGRRNDAGGPVPYVGADYAAAVAELARRAIGLGHRRLAYLGVGVDAESSVDRRRGFHEQVSGAGLPAVERTSPGRSAADLLDELRADATTAVFVEDFATAVALHAAATRRGVNVPADLSIVVLGDPTTPVPSDTDFTTFHIPRQEMGRQAVEVLAAVLNGSVHEAPQRLLPCEPVDGTTLCPPR